MSAIRCPYCGTQGTDVAVRGDSSFLCPSCGKAVEPPLAGNDIEPPPLQDSCGRSDRWSDGPPQESANRWSAQAPLGDDSSSSESVSQSSFFPQGDAEQAVVAKPARSPLVWALIVLAVFLAALTGVTLLARAVRPWLAARRAAAEQATVDFWLPRLDKGGDDARVAAALAIVALGPKAVCGALDHISKDPGNRLTPATVRALASAGVEAVPGLCEALRSPEPQVRDVAIKVLQQMGASGQAACDRLIAILDDKNPSVRFDAIDTLGYLGAAGAPAVKRLAEIAASPDDSARRRAIEALGRIGPEAREARGVLQRAADDPDAAIRASASSALKQIDVARLAREARRDATGQMKEWLDALQGDDTPTAVAAAMALGKLGFDGRPAAAGLASMLHSSDRDRRVAAATALGQLGLANVDFTPTLEAAAKEEDGEVRAAAARALALPGKP